VEAINDEEIMNTKIDFNKIVSLKEAVEFCNEHIDNVEIDASIPTCLNCIYFLEGMFCVRHCLSFREMGEYNDAEWHSPRPNNHDFCGDGHWEIGAFARLMPPKKQEEPVD
jgi:hypothetical protein